MSSSSDVLRSPLLIPVRTLTPNRLKLALLVSGILLLALPPCLAAQDTGDAPLGDVARSFRKKPPSSEAVIDNDNCRKWWTTPKAGARLVHRWCSRSIPQARAFTSPRPMSAAAFRSARRPVRCSPIRCCWTSCRAANWPSSTGRRPSTEIRCRSRCTTERRGNCARWSSA